jgi:hypothetical protein
MEYRFILSSFFGFYVLKAFAMVTQHPLGSATLDGFAGSGRRKISQHCIDHPWVH